MQRKMHTHTHPQPTTDASAPSLVEMEKLHPRLFQGQSCPKIQAPGLMNSPGRRRQKTVAGTWLSSISSQMTRFQALETTPTGIFPLFCPCSLHAGGRCLGPGGRADPQGPPLAKPGPRGPCLLLAGPPPCKPKRAASLLPISARPSLAYQPDGPPTPFSLKKSDLIS